MDELPALSLAKAGELVGRKELSPVEYTQALCERIDALDAQLATFVRPMPEEAMAAAHAAAAEIQGGRWRGPLHGLPYALKDIIDVAGVPTTAHSKILADNIPVHDAFVTSRLKAAGAICLGKLSTHEFAIGGPSFDLPWPPARNPWNSDHHPGGSSSGAGAALAAGFTPAAIGTDTAGSVRNPASMCGVVGLKPTYGLVSRRGVVPLSFSLDHVGPLARSVEDCAILLEAIAGHDSADASSAKVPQLAYRSELRRGVRGLRIGYVRHFHAVDTPDVDPEMAASIDAAADVLRDEGARVDEISLAPLPDYEAVQRMIQMPEAYSIHERWLKERPADYGKLARQRLLTGAFVSGTDYVTALRMRGKMVRDFAAATRGLDAVICASSMEPAAQIADAAEVARTYRRHARMVFNVLGNPALALPTGFSATGLPLAMQIVGAPFCEAMVLRVAYAYERATGWHQSRPLLAAAAEAPTTQSH